MPAKGSFQGDLVPEAKSKPTAIIRRDQVTLSLLQARAPQTELQ